MSILIYYYAIISILTLFAYGLDKISAIYKLRRTPEKILLLLTIAGGCFGALLGMILFRHKKNKLGFIIITLTACAAHGYVLLFGWERFGFKIGTLK
ncbi:DUF1294 domain-containing protein [Candidatus Falkowbacteria bacterium]|nr:DUF1294 domain-containing protein [Candidatus Falkowbacteria bacterium]